MIEVELTFTRACKHVVRYDADAALVDGKAPVKDIYLDKGALEQLSGTPGQWPPAIAVRIGVARA